MDIIEGILYLEFSDLIKHGWTDTFLWTSTKENRKGLKPSYYNIPNPYDKRKVIISYDSIPEATRIQKGLPSKESLIKTYNTQNIKSLLVHDTKALSFYLSNPYTMEYAKDMQEISAYLMLCASISKDLVKSMGYTKTDSFLETVMMLMFNTNEHWNSYNLQNFKRRSLKPFKTYFKSEPNHFNPLHADYYNSSDQLHSLYEDALDSLISKKYGKKNSAKLKLRNDERGKRQSEQQQAKIITLFSSPAPKLTVTQTYLAYIRTATEKYSQWQAEVASNIPEENRQGWDKKCLITEQSVSNFLYQRDIKQIWYEARHGKKAYDNKFERTTKRRPASFANAKWVIDGTPWHRYYVKDGKAFARMNVFVVLDAHSWAVIGFYVHSNENSYQVISALRNACKISGHVPYEIQSDNSKAIQSVRAQWAIDNMSKYNIPARPGNAKAKIIEPFFKHFNARILKFRKGYTGNPFAKNLDDRANPDTLIAQRNKGQFPNEKQAIAEMIEDFTMWNNHEFRGGKPIEMYRNSLKETSDIQRKFTEDIDKGAFWYIPGKIVQIDAPKASKQKKISVLKPQTYTYSNNGITVAREIEGKGKMELLYDVPSAGFNAEYMHEKFQLKIEPENWDKACLYSEDGSKPITDLNGNHLMATERFLGSNAKVDELPDEAKKLAANEAIKPEQKKLVKTKRKNFEKIAKEANLLEASIDATSIYGKQIINNGKSLLFEGAISDNENNEPRRVLADTADSTEYENSRF